MGNWVEQDYQTKQYFIIIKYWLKIVNSAERKYGKYIYNTMLADLEENDRQINWALLVKRLLSNLGFYWSLVATKCRWR